nr:helix-turn-helix transcriptional regulator [Parafrankia sp. EUN1f]
MAKPALGIRASAVREGIADLCEQRIAPEDLVAEVAERVRRVVPYDAGSWMTTDPETLLPTRLHAVGPKVCLRADDLHDELAGTGVNGFLDLDRSGRCAVSLAASTGGELDRATRHRSVYEPLGLRDELRLLARDGSATWGMGCLRRADDEPDFTAAEVRYVASIARHLGHGLRSGLARTPPPRTPLAGSGTLVLDAAGRLEASTAEADRWLRRISPVEPPELPVSVTMVAVQAQANAAGGGPPRPARLRMSLPGGGWLLVQGEVLVSSPAHGGAGAARTAVVLEPASRADLLPVMLALYGLTSRERQLAELLVAGHGTDRIARRLGISQHTVRDHTKAIFAKVNVASRAELTAVLGAEVTGPPVDVPTGLGTAGLGLAG